MNKYKNHQKLLKQSLSALQKALPNARLFERHVGLFKTMSGTPIKINQKGMADAYGIINGQHFELEFKTGNAKQTKEQKNWQKLCEKIGVKYYIIRKIEDIEQIIQDYSN